MSWGVRRELVLLNLLIFQEGCRRLMARVLGAMQSAAPHVCHKSLLLLRVTRERGLRHHI